MKSPGISWVMGLIVFAIGTANLLLVHPVPGLIGLLLSVLFLPPVHRFTKERFGFQFSFVLQVILCLAVVWFTFAVSDLGDMID